ncbi:CatB-related O-acetyltransferase [Chryseobacterium sp. SIMBA_028]|uniref:CatB-related O-acetyltransferase n=1 Tax=Chryseobacterium sp. SIMBA_028 TaxID=3085771 RepID=UPI00397BEACF
MSRLFSYIKSIIAIVVFKIKWRKFNSHNFTTAKSLFSKDRVKVGRFSYGPLEVFDYGEKNAGLEIGSFCSIALNVKFILGGNHFIDGLFSYPISPMLINDGEGGYSKGKIIIGDNCWIGFGSTIVSGVELGNGCVVAAGTVVTKSFPSYSIIGGSPAKVIRKRFDDETIEMLENNPDIYNKDISWYKENHKDLVKTKCNIDLITEILKR